MTLVEALLLIGLIILFWIIGYYIGQRDGKQLQEQTKHD